MKKPAQIHQFDPVIYPVKLWISITDNLYPIADRFVKSSKKDFDVKFASKFHAFTQTVVEKETSLWGVMMVFKSKKSITSGVMAHEATHAAREIWDRIGEHSTGIEADAYLVEWIVDCIDQVNKNKFKTF